MLSLIQTQVLGNASISGRPVAPLNDAPDDKPDAHGNSRRIWKRLNEDSPNDYRDVARYSYGAMCLATRNQPPKPRSVVYQTKATPRKQEQKQPGFIRRPGRGESKAGFIRKRNS